MQKAHSDKYISANVILKQKQQLGALLIGDCTSAIDKHVLKPYKVYTVITIGQDSAPARQQQHIAYILHNVLDNKSQKIDDMFDTVYEQIEAGRKAGGVLVHCYTGISRSPAFVIAYLMRKKFTAYDDARAFVKKQRTVAHPNDNFHRQLQGYWKLLQARNQEQKSIIKVETKQVEHKQQQISSQSELMMSNLSAVSKRTIRGIKGAVPPAFRSKSIQNRSIEETNQHSKDKQADSSTISPNKQTKKTEQRQKQVTQIYSNKTKVI